MRSALASAAAVVVTAMVAVGLSAQPAAAATVTVATFEELQAATAAGCANDTVIIGADITGELLAVDCTVTIDLGGRALRVGNISIGNQLTLTIDDPNGGGEVHADATASIATGAYAGISTGGATLIVNGGTITALGSAGAGIGGNIFGDAGTINIMGGHVTATGGVLSAGIGGGSGTPSVGDGRGGDVTIGAAATVIAIGGVEAPAIGAGVGAGDPPDFGSLLVAGTLRLPDGYLQVPDSDAAGPEVVVAATGRILGTEADPSVGAAITGDGQIENGGAIALTGVADTVTVLTNNYDVSFDAQDGSAPAVVRVLAPTFNAGHRALPPLPPGGIWATAPDETGALFTGDSVLSSVGTTTPKPVTLYARGGIDALRVAAATCPDGYTITLVENLSGASFVVGCDLTLDLAGHGLTVSYVDVTPGSTFTVDDGLGGGALVADTQGSALDRQAGIGVPVGAGLVIAGGSVEARSSLGAGIGGDDDGLSQGGSAGSVVITGGTVVAEADQGGAGIGGATGSGGGGSGGDVLITGGTVTARSPFGAAGIGGGAQGYSGAGGDAGAGGTVRIEGGVVTSGGACGIGGCWGDGGVVDIAGGTVTASGFASALGGIEHFGTLTIRAGAIVYVPTGPLVIPDSNSAGAEVVIEDGGVLLGTPADETQGATISGAGQIHNGGVIALDESLVGVTVLDHNFLLSFETDAQPEPQPVRVFASSVASGYRALPAPPTGRDWNTANDGSGQWWTDASALGADTILYAATDATLTFVDPPASVDQGGSVTFVVTGVDHEGNPVDTTDVVLTSSVATDQVDGLTVTFPSASPHTITATLGTATTALSVEVIPVAAPPSTAPEVTPLPATGSTFDATVPVALAVIMLLLGCASLLYSVRRRSVAQ